MAKTTGLPVGRRFPIRATIVGVVLVIGLATFVVVTNSVPQVRRLIPGLAQPAPTYQTTRVSRGNLIVGITATGPIAAVQTIPVTFKTSGQLAELKVGVGDHVQQGQIMAVLDTTDLKAAVDQAKSALDQAQANDTKVEAGPTVAQRDVAQASLDSTKDSAATTQANLLTAKTTVSDALVTAGASIHTSELNLTSAQHAIATTQSQGARTLAADQAAVTVDQKNLASVQASVAANDPILQQSVERAKTSLWSTQIGRDLTCGRTPGTECAAANANVAGAEMSVTTAADQVKQTKITEAQQIAQAQTTVDQAIALLAADKAKLAESLVTGKDQVAQANAALTNAQNGLVQAQHQASASVESAQAQANQANDSLASAQAGYRLSIQPPAAADVVTAKAQVVTAQGALTTAQANLDAANLVAPTDATVAAINGAAGQFVSGGPVAVGGTALFTLVDLRNLKVTAQVNEADIGQVKVGEAVTFSFNTFPNKTFTGKVLSIQPIGTTTQNVVTYSVTTSIQVPSDSQLYPGMTATATIISAEHDGVLQVPSTALTFAQSAARPGTGSTNRGGGGAPGGQNQAQGGPANTNRAVVMVLKNNQLTPVQVTTGLADDVNTEIASGLTGSELVVVGVRGQTTTTSGTGTRPTGGPGGGVGGGAVSLFFPI